MLDPSLSLKITPPRVRAASLPRAWLARLFDRMRDRRVVVVCAPAGRDFDEVEVDTLVDVANAVSYCTLSVALVHAYSMEPFYLRIVNPVVILPPFSHWSCLVK